MTNKKKAAKATAAKPAAAKAPLVKESAAAVSQDRVLVAAVGLETDPAEAGVQIDAPTASANSLAALDRLRVMATDKLQMQKGETERGALNDLLDQISAAKDEINSDAIQQHTVSLQAAEDELAPGIKGLTDLKQKLEALTQTITDVDKLVAGIADAVGCAQTLLKTFP